MTSARTVPAPSLALCTLSACPRDITGLSPKSYSDAAGCAGQDQGKTQGSKAAKPLQPASADVPADPVSSGQIKYIHATGGKVVVISKKDEQEVTGEDAVYDVKAQKITMTGKEVILTQKKNVVKGKQLNIDLATGRAVVIPEKGRVQAIFSQDSAKGIISANEFLGTKKKDDAPAPESPKHPEPQPGWQPQSH